MVIGYYKNVFFTGFFMSYKHECKCCMSVNSLYIDPGNPGTKVTNRRRQKRVVVAILLYNNFYKEFQRSL